MREATAAAYPGGEVPDDAVGEGVGAGVRLPATTPGAHGEEAEREPQPEHELLEAMQLETAVQLEARDRVSVGELAHGCRVHGGGGAGKG